VFGKKKAMAPRSENFHCQVPGCGVNCLDRETLERHMNWAHRELVAAGNQKEAMLSQEQKS
jgi:hypothetical protein